MQDFNVSHIDDQQQLNRNIRRLRAQTLLSWEKERRMLDWWGLRNGMSILEVGSGPGFITERLFAGWPASPITAVEIDSTFISWANEHVYRDKIYDQLHIVNTPIMETGLPENSFDFAFARFVFQHLPQPLEAAREIWRLLKPGGKLVILDSDDAIFGMLQPPLPALRSILERFGQIQAQRGGDRHIGWQLWRVLQAAGFQKLELETIAFHSDDLGMEAFQQLLDPDRLLALVTANLVTEQEFVAAHASCEQFISAPDSFVLMLWLMICGEKV